MTMLLPTLQTVNHQPTTPAHSAAQPTSSTADFVAVQMSDGRIVHGFGPFTRHRTAPPGWAFYVNNFTLSEPRPWLVPSRLSITPITTAAPREIEIPNAWTPPDQAAFAEIFHDLMRRIADGSLSKAVPVVAETAAWPEPSWRNFQHHVLQQRGTARTQTFAFQSGNSGFAGRTPEILFELRGSVLHTMALAGTTAAQDTGELLAHPKLQREHELVVEALWNRLATIGTPRLHPRSIMPLGSLTHLCTELECQLQNPQLLENPEELIALLHPTPALGISPKTPENLALLHTCRRKMGIPAAFAAPFGVKWNGGLSLLVAIRGFFWENGRASLPAGCGIVAGSELRSEWAELDLKRRWVRLNLAGA